MKKHILICCLPSDLSGVPEYVRQLCELDPHNYKISILTKEKGAAFKDSRLPKNVSVICDENLENRFSFKAFKLLRASLKRHIVKLDPDILHLNGAMFSVAGRTVRVPKICRRIVTFHGLPYGKGVAFKQNVILFPLELLLQNIVNCHNVFISKENLKRAAKLQLTNYENSYVPNCAAEPLESESTLDWENKPDRFRIISIAVFRPQKDHQLLFRAFNLLPPKFELILVGRNTDSGEIIDLAKSELHNDKFSRVSFMGERSDIYELLTNADLFVLTSKYEGMPIAALEALAVGLPIIMTNVSGADEICEGGYGLIARDRKPASIAHALTKIASLVEINGWDREASRAHFRKNFTKKSFLREMDRIYRS